MTALFADTFYWIALADFSDSAHQRALVLTSERTHSLLVTTDEVLTEYLTVFATAPEPMRRKAITNAERILRILAFVSFPRVGPRFSPHGFLRSAAR
jgi:hypothetical protein